MTTTCSYELLIPQSRFEANERTTITDKSDQTKNKNKKRYQTQHNIFKLLTPKSGFWANKTTTTTTTTNRQITTNKETERKKKISNTTHYFTG